MVFLAFAACRAFTMFRLAARTGLCDAIQHHLRGVSALFYKYPCHVIVTPETCQPGPLAPTRESWRDAAASLVIHLPIRLESERRHPDNPVDATGGCLSPGGTRPHRGARDRSCCTDSSPSCPGRDSRIGQLGRVFFPRDLRGVGRARRPGGGRPGVFLWENRSASAQDRGDRHVGGHRLHHLWSGWGVRLRTLASAHGRLRGPGSRDRRRRSLRRNRLADHFGGGGGGSDAYAGLVLGRCRRMCHPDRVGLARQDWPGGVDSAPPLVGVAADTDGSAGTGFPGCGPALLPMGGPGSLVDPG